MALAYAQYPGNGSTGPYNVTFPFISKAHVQVKVDGNQVAFTWLTNTTIRLTTPAPINSIIDIRRVTPRDTLLVDFVDGSTLVESDLDLSALQVFYLSQEAFDLGEASLGVTEDGSFSALNRRISNVLDPVNATDVATKRFVETGMTSQLAAATAAKDASVVARQGSESARTGSEAARAGAEAARDEAKAHRDTASGHRLNAQIAQTGAETARAGAEAAKIGLEAARDTAVTKAVEAATSAAAALKFAQDAALFDPSSYYTKAQVDTQIGNVDLSNFYTKTQVYTKTELTSLLAAKAPLASPAFSGLVSTVGATGGYRFANRSSNDTWLLQSNNGLLTFYWGADGGSGSAGNKFTLNYVNGEISTPQLGDLKTYIDNSAGTVTLDKIANALGSMTLASVGSIVLAISTVAVGITAATAGSNLKTAYVASTGAVTGVTTLSGTWKALGSCVANSATNFVRVA